MKTKKQYIAPTMKCVEFKVERGYAGSMTQGLGNWHGKPDGLYLDNFETYNEGNPFSSDGPHGGFFSGDNSDWD